MGALLHRLSVLNRNNPVTKGRCTQPVRNHNRCRVLIQLQKLLVNLLLRTGSIAAVGSSKIFSSAS